MKLVPRLASPVGFLLALLFFLLPFVAVSCEVPGIGSADASYTGLDLATGGDPSVHTEGEFSTQTDVPVPSNDEAPKTDVQALAIITVALLVIGLGVSLAPVLRTRTFGAMGAAVAGATLLIVTEAVAQSNLRSAIAESAREAASARPGDISFDPSFTGGLFDDLVRSRYGFWLSLVAVILVLLFNAGLLLWPRIRAASQPAAVGPPPSPDPATPASATPAEPDGGPPPPQ